VPFDQVPITAADIVLASEGQVRMSDAETFVRGLSPGQPITGFCLIAQARELGRRYRHAALPRDVARRVAKALCSPFVPEAALREMLRREDGLRDIGDCFQRFQIGKAVDALLDLDAAAKAAE
jgi:hypothetical protein